MQDDPRRLQRLVRLAAGRPRGAQLGLPLPLRAGRPRHGDRQLGEARALSVDPRGGAAARRGPDLVARRRSDRRLQRALPHQGAEEDRRAAPRSAARRAPGALHPRRLEGRPVRRSRRSAARAQAARDHQRPAHGGHGRGRPALRRQRDDRRRGAAVGRGDEGGGGAPRAAHGEGRQLDQGHDRARHREGRRARHRQEPGRHHSRQQRLQDRQSRHQGAARGADQGVSPAPAGRDRSVGAAGQVGADDGGHGAGPESRRRELPDPGRRRGAVEPLHAAQDRAGVRRRGGVCQGRDDRAWISPTSSWMRTSDA